MTTETLNIQATDSADASGSNLNCGICSPAPDEATLAEAVEIISAAHNAVLSMVTAKGLPYATPVTTFVQDGAIYFHSKKRPGLRGACLEASNKVHLTYIAHAEIAPKAFNVFFKSLTVFGEAQKVADEAERRERMRRFCKSLDADLSDEAIEGYLKRFFDRMELWHIQVQGVSIKKSTE